MIKIVIKLEMKIKSINNKQIIQIKFPFRKIKFKMIFQNMPSKSSYFHANKGVVEILEKAHQ